MFSNEELFIIFQQSKPILLFLLKTKIITIDEIIFGYLLNYTGIREGEDCYYFYPELKSVIESGSIKSINSKKFNIKLNEDIEKFETTRQKFENETNLCSIIREDLIDDFIKYVHQTNISLSSQIERSIFETNSMFIEKDTTLIEYATFFGSIQIIKYLEINRVNLEPSLWLYAVHSNNPEVIQFLEEKKIELDDRTFSEAIKCHHNNIANYIQDNYLDDSLDTEDLYDESILSDNFEFFPYEIEGNEIFVSLCQGEYYELVDLYLSLKKKDIDNYLDQIEGTEILIF